MRAAARLVTAVALAASVGGCRQVLGYEDATLEVCQPGAKQACEGAGTQTCKDDGTGWEACVIPPGSVVWTALFGGKEGATLTGLAVDGEGNIFLGGSFQGMITFGRTKLTSVAMGGDAFLAKLGPDGAPVWAKRFGTGTLGALAADSSGRVTMSTRVAQGDDVGCGKSTIGGPCVAQYDGTGACLWSRVYDASNSTFFGVSGSAVDPVSSDVVVAGNFSNSVDLGDGTFTTSGDTDTDIFVTRLHSGPSATGGGSTAWATQLGGTMAGTRYPWGVAVRGVDGSTEIVGQFVGDLEGTPSMAAPMSGASDAFYVTLSSAGKVQTTKTYGGGTNQYPMAVAVDPAGDTLFTGYITGTVSFGGAPLMTSGANDKNTFLVKINPQFLVYSKEWGDGAFDLGTSIATDKDSNVVLTGATLGTINFGGMDLENLGQGTLYLAKLNPAAKHIWSMSFGDTTTQVEQNPLVAVDPKTQQVIFASDFMGSLDFGKEKLTADGQNIAVAKFSP
jgi:hypothetical protein